MGYKQKDHLVEELEDEQSLGICLNRNPCGAVRLKEKKTIEMIKFWSKLGGNDWIDSGVNLVGSVNILKDLFQASIVSIMFDIYCFSSIRAFLSLFQK